jgi:hypothetical protein
MLATEVLSYKVYAFDNGILMQRLLQELHSRFAKKVDVGHLFLNVVNQEQGNTIV